MCFYPLSLLDSLDQFLSHLQHFKLGPVALAVWKGIKVHKTCNGVCIERLGMS